MSELNNHPQNLFDEFLHLESTLHRYFAWKRPEKGPHANPHRGQGRILSILKLQPTISQRELSYLLDIRPQSLAELLGKLEKAEFITRQPSEQDKRVMVVELTEAGKAEAEKMQPETEDSVFDMLSEEEQQNFYQLMHKISTTIQAEMPEDFGPMKPRGRGFGGHRDFERGGKDHWRHHEPPAGCRSKKEAGDFSHHTGKNPHAKHSDELPQQPDSQTLGETEAIGQADINH